MKEEQNKIYLAHKSEDGTRKQNIKDHLFGTAKLAQEFANKFLCGDLGYCAGILHDIGKYSEAFQKRISGIINKPVDHSTAGAKLCWNKDGLYGLLSYCIAGHHSGLPNGGNSKVDTADNSSLCGRMKKYIEPYEAYKIDGLSVPNLNISSRFMENICNDKFTCSLLIRMIFSCLVDADFLDTEYFMKNSEIKRDSGESIESLCEKFNNYISKWLNQNDYNTVNGRRTQILKNCISKGNGEKGIYQLTVPTGGGKTIASFGFALEHAKKNNMDRIIYVIPYTSIIEQNAEVFRNILGESNVLEHHCNVNYDYTQKNEEIHSIQLASENWDKPVVVTTNVQFFESFFSNKPSVCRKLHNIANSVIIFDEAQMIPVNYLKPCIKVMKELVENYRSSIVICTATQPEFQQFFGNKADIIELCPYVEKQFSFFKRATLKNLKTISLDELAQRLKSEHQVLCILNTRKQVQKLYKQMCEINDNGVYHLSTTMYPKHRKKTFKKIRESLSNREKCIVISTSLVEAGVDLDFKTVFRQFAGVDSIIQAMGRCNREGKISVSESVTYVFKLEEIEKIPEDLELRINATESVLKEQHDVHSPEIIKKYFEELYLRKSNFDKCRVLERFKKENFPFATVSKEFKLIKEETQTVFIAKEKEAKEILEEIKFNVRKGRLSRSLMRKTVQYSINVYNSDFNKLKEKGAIEEISVNLENFFVLGNLDYYDDKQGLILECKNDLLII